MKQIVLSVAALILLASTSCKKKVVDPISGTFTTLSALESTLRTQPKITTLDAARGGSFYGTSGTRYFISGNSLMTATGASVTGTVEIKTLECLTKADMILQNAYPVSGGEPLISGGELSISATQGGNPLYLKPGVMFAAYVPQAGGVVPDMGLFFGGDTKGTPTWRMNRDTARGGVFYYGGDTITVYSDSLNWVNIDQFYTYSTKNITINYTADGVATNLTDFTVATSIDARNSIISLPTYRGTKSGNVILEPNYPALNSTIVAYGIYNGNLYGATKKITPVDGLNVVLDMKKLTTTEFMNILKGI